MTDEVDRLSDHARRELTWLLGDCEQDGVPARSLRSICREAGVPIATMSRFLAGRPVSSTTLDAIWSFLHPAGS